MLILKCCYRNYGRLSNYFTPRQIDCVPPSDWANTKKAVALGADNWRDSSRIKYSRLNLGALDDWTREEYFGASAAQDAVDALSELRQWTNVKRDMLPEGNTLPFALERVFEDLSKATQDGWSRLRPDIRRQVNQARTVAGLEVPPELEGRGIQGGAVDHFRSGGSKRLRGPVIG